MSTFFALKKKATWTFLALLVMPLTGLAAEHPILLTVNDANPNGAGVRFLVESAGMPGDASSYHRLVLLFDGEDPEAVETARTRWSEAKAAGFDVTYWQADERGRWQRQA